MFRYITGFLIGAFALSTLQLHVANAKASEEADMWTEVCAFIANYEYTCGDLDAPTVLDFTPAPADAEKHFGSYNGGDYILISTYREGFLRRSTLFHEMVHYIHQKQGIVDITRTYQELCWSEAETFALQDQWLVGEGREDLVRPNWLISYPHCWAVMGYAGLTIYLSIE